MPRRTPVVGIVKDGLDPAPANVLGEGLAFFGGREPAIFLKALEDADGLDVLAGLGLGAAGTDQVVIGNYVINWNRNPGIGRGFLGSG